MAAVTDETVDVARRALRIRAGLTMLQDGYTAIEVTVASLQSERDRCSEVPEACHRRHPLALHRR